jgi:hypothetical protein
MARTGVLSDEAVKVNCPEFFPPDLASQSIMLPIAMQRHIYTGIKVPKETKTYAFSRFPVSDMRNMAVLADPVRTEQIFRNSIAHYRAQIGLKPHVKAYEPTEIGDSTYLSEAATDFADTDSMAPLHSPPGVLTLRRSARHALTAIEQEMPGIGGVLEPRTQLMLANLAPGGDYSNVMFALGMANPKGRISHGEALSRLQTHYRDSHEDLDRLVQANAAADAMERMQSKSMGAGNVVPSYYDAREMMAQIEEEGVDE